LAAFKSQNRNILLKLSQHYFGEIYQVRYSIIFLEGDAMMNTMINQDIFDELCPIANESS